jgi:hypothetical protein
MNDATSQPIRHNFSYYDEIHRIYIVYILPPHNPVQTTEHLPTHNPVQTTEHLPPHNPVQTTEHLPPHNPVHTTEHLPTYNPVQTTNILRKLTGNFNRNERKFSPRSKFL